MSDDERMPGGEVLADPDITAAGTVLWRTGPDGPEVLLVHRPKYDDWSLPKGKRKRGERLLITAVRETLEETSVRPVLGSPLGAVSYPFRGLVKRVDYWSAVTADEARPSHEVDGIAWLSLHQAAERLSYPHDRDVIYRLVPRGTVPLIILRHASAVPKGIIDDLLRPLDASGRHEADALAGLLACFAPHARVLSSPALRCTQTVAPYAAQAGVAIEENQNLARTGGGITPGPLIRALIRERRPAIVCLHRENTPVALGAACSELGADPADDPGLSKGGFWVVHADGELMALEKHEPDGTLMLISGKARSLTGVDWLLGGVGGAAPAR
ncbi:MAG TPA: NUDIX domain-containing protein [Streptosporangiaceae bacterium]